MKEEPKAMRLVNPLLMLWMALWAFSWALVGGIAWALFTVFTWLLLGATQAHAQELPQGAQPLPSERRARPPGVAGAQEAEVNASGIFLNTQGDVLTAKHAVTGCRALYVVKDGQVSEASIQASSQNLDIAVLRTTLKPYLSATFAQTPPTSDASVGVFAESHSELQRLAGRATLMSNAMTIPGGDGLHLLSGARPGASGSGVLAGNGLLLGMVVERVGAAPHATGRVLSRGPGRPSNGATQVRAVTGAQVTRFLREHHIPFDESDTAQLGPTQSPAARASTLSVGVLCG